MNITEPELVASEQTGANHPVWQLSFRSFFLAGGLFSAVSVGFWALLLAGWITMSQQMIPSTLWHAHEMIFGFAALIVVGFILTAVQTWTGSPSIKGLPVIVLLLIWLLVRVLIFVNTATSVLFAVMLLALFWCSVITIYARLVFSVRNKRNYLFVPILCALGTLNIITLVLSVLGLNDTALHIARSAILLFTIIMGTVGGRVIPFFTSIKVRVEPNGPVNWLEKLLLPLSLIGMTIFIVGYFVPLPISPAVFMIITGSLHFVRMTGWSSFKTHSVPLLWSLHISYGFMAIGLITLGFSYFIRSLQFSTALHLITLGAIGLMIISMMSRVSLGHTGRLLEVKPQVVLAFIFMVIATLLRFFLSQIGYFIEAWLISASLWIFSFTIFFFTYWPVLTAPRQ